MNVCLLCGKIENKNLLRKNNFERIGLNTGNMLFWYALSSILQVEQHTIEDFIEDFKWKKADASEFDSFITTDLIWIQENTEFPSLDQQLQIAGDRPLVPISVGLQSGQQNRDFHLHEHTQYQLSQIQERCVIGVRGEYTADVLSRNGIRNIQVIGCPSMYLPFDYEFKIWKKDAGPQHVNVNMRSMFSPLSKQEMRFLVYAANHNCGFCEQTNHPFTPQIYNDAPTFEYLNTWFSSNKMIYFDVEDWREYMSQMDFSMGCRFHGNVIALWEHVPSLFVTIDSRTEELCQHFSLPTISLEEFDRDKDMRYYYDLADYSDFNKYYANRLDEFITFLKTNHLPIRPRIDGYYDRRIKGLEEKIQRLLDSKLS